MACFNGLFQVLRNGFWWTSRKEEDTLTNVKDIYDHVIHVIYCVEHVSHVIINQNRC